MEECGVQSGECGVEERTPSEVRSSTPHSALRFPHFALAVKHRRLVWGPRGGETKVPVRARRGAAAARRAGEEPLLHQEGLVHFFERARILAYGRSDGREPDRPAVELLDD